MSCDSPVLIKNPYYKKPLNKGLNFLHDCKSQYMRVPCGHCPSCIATKQMYIIQRFYMESLDSYIFFSTLTYDNEHLPSLNVNGFNIRYANFKHFTDMVKRIRKSNLFTRPFRYFAVSELGKERHRPHFHCLWFLPKFPKDTPQTPYILEKLLYTVIYSQWKVNVSSSDKYPVYEPLFTFKAKLHCGILYKNFDTHYVRPKLGSVESSSVAFYCMKYLLKGSEYERRLQQALRLNLEPSEYEVIWNKIKSRSQFSKHFGYGYNPDNPKTPTQLVLDYIRKGVKATPKGSPYPVFISPVDGSTYPLSPYYQSRSLFYSFEDAFPILMASSAPVESCLEDDFFQKAKVSFEKYQKHLCITEKNGNPLLFD